VRDRALLIAVLLLTAFAGPRVVSGFTGLGEWAERRALRSPVGGEQVALEELEAGFGPGASRLQQEVALPAQVVDFTPESTTVRTFPSTDYTDPAAGPRAATTDWRVVMGTGNAAELWLHGTQDGRLLDLGGRYVNYTDDGGVTWKSVRPAEPLVNAEGSVIAAPNGDVVAVTWDPYSGDRVITYKYVAAEKAWYYMYQPIHTPFWDRPMIDVVPGPFTDPLGNSVPYLTFINGLPHDPWQYSYDGLNYPGISYRSRDASSTPPISSWLDVKPDPMRDFTQVEADGLFFGFAPLDDGKAWSENLMFTREDMKWHRWTTPDGDTIEGPLQIDSRGWLHNVLRSGTGFEYRVSTDGGRSWSTVQVPEVGRPGDFKANAAAGVAAVWSLKGKKDVVTKLDITGAQPSVLGVYDVGLGDDSRTGGIGFYGLTGGHRFDFSSIVVLPDGRVAVSFMDSKTKMHFPTLGTEVVAPGLAVELDTTVPGG
jgi:hypothetical protein